MCSNPRRQRKNKESRTVGGPDGIDPLRKMEGGRCRCGCSRNASTKTGTTVPIEGNCLWLLLNIEGQELLEDLI